MRLALTLTVLLGGCASAPSPSPASYAMYAEFAKSNLKMKPGLNRRVFNTVEAQQGTDIRLEPDGSITLRPGTYRITGFSIVTMQVTMAEVEPKNRTNYPGYCIVYRKEVEMAMKDPLGIGTPCTALDTVPSQFDLFFTCTKETQICVGHQSGRELHDEVYLAVEEVDGTKSPFHVFARITILKQ